MIGFGGVQKKRNKERNAQPRKVAATHVGCYLCVCVFCVWWPCSYLSGSRNGWLLHSHIEKSAPKDSKYQISDERQNHHHFETLPLFWLVGAKRCGACYEYAKNVQNFNITRDLHMVQKLRGGAVYSFPLLTKGQNKCKNCRTHPWDLKCCADDTKERRPSTW